MSFEVLVIWNQLAIVISDEFGVGSVLTYNELETFLSESKPVETLDNINNDSKYPFRVANPNEYNFDSVAYQSKHLFGGLWHHNELCILFGPTNVGKSVLSVQIGVNIALGGAIFNGELDCFEAQKVLYVDFELSEKQFKSRYGNFVFPPNFFRAELDFNHPEAGVNRLSLIDCLTSLVREHDAQVLIIDNLSAIQSDNTQASEAAKLIQAFNAMKRALSISILLVGHTTKHNRQLPLELNNLAGSAQMANLIDSSFAIGKSHPKGLYVKQLKQRNEEQKYGESSVINANIENGSNGELIFNFEGFSEESKLLAPSQVIREERNSQIRELYARGLTQAQIGKELGIGKSTVGDVLRQSQSNGEQNSTNDLPF